MANSRSVAEDLAQRVASLDVRGLPQEVRDTCERLLIDVVGLCVAARATDYVTAARQGWPDTGAATVIGRARNPQRCRGRLHQWYRCAWRGLRRHLRRRPGACRGGRGSGGARRCGAGTPARLRCAARHSGGSRDHLPPEPGGAKGDAQGGFPSDRGARRNRGRGRRRCRATTGPAPARRRAWASPARWPAVSSSTSPTAAGPSACIRDGPRNLGCALPCWLAPASTGRAPCSKACTACFMASPTRARALRRAARWFRRALADADACLQALPLRHDDPPLHRLRPPPGAGDRCRGRARWSARSARALCTGCGSRWRKSRPPNGYAAKFSTPYGIAVWPDQRRSRPRCFHRCRGRRCRRARASRQGAIRGRSGQSLSERVHRPHPRA